MFDVEIIRAGTIVVSETEAIVVDEGDVWTVFGTNNNNEFLCYGENRWFWLPMDCCVPYRDYDEDWE